jgi:hypothetical protein
MKKETVYRFLYLGPAFASGCILMFQSIREAFSEYFFGLLTSLAIFTLSTSLI